MGLVCGVGINDADYSVVGYSKDSNGKTVQTMCKYYRTWKSMLRRCYYKKDNLSYNDCKVCDEWLRFSNFKAWMEGQNYEEGLHLDKDILVKGNKVYSPCACVFIPNEVNSQSRVNTRINSTGFIGVVEEKRTKVPTYRAQLTGGPLKGIYKTPIEAHRSWQVERAAQLEGLVVWYRTKSYFRTDVACALTNKVWKLRLDNILNITTVEV
jgi:hypothetical protein